jgi:hypothetical protein
MGLPILVGLGVAGVALFAGLVVSLGRGSKPADESAVSDKPRRGRSSEGTDLDEIPYADIAPPLGDSPEPVSRRRG